MLEYRHESKFMTGTQVTILAALIGSPFLYATFEYLRDKILARFKYQGWQAVFLSTGQVYFGHITSVSKNDLLLTDIYYMQTDGENAGYPKGKSDNISLVKLGDELHGPKDTMTIGRAHITFTETLKENSQVVEAISDHRREERLADVKLKDIGHDK